jgi:acyl-CoA synthetase (AMP-forming)/AMP-acid ligase II
MFCVPSLLALLVQESSATGRDYSALKTMLTGGAPITDATALRARDIFGPVLYQLYGQTEALPASVMGPKEWFSKVPGSNPLRSAGRPLPFAEIEIRGPDGTALPVGGEGEIAIRSESQMTGFWGDPQRTAERLVDGWVLSGDIGTMDANGYLYVLDRKDDMIISGGFNIWPAELENVISDHPAVLEVAVFGIPHERWGETPMARCVTDGATEVSETEIVDLVSRALGSYMKPTRVEFRTEELPKSPVGKLQRKVLREPYWSGVERRVSGS